MPSGQRNERTRWKSRWRWLRLFGSIELHQARTGSSRAGAGKTGGPETMTFERPLSPALLVPSLRSGVSLSLSPPLFSSSPLLCLRESSSHPPLPVHPSKSVPIHHGCVPHPSLHRPRRPACRSVGYSFCWSRRHQLRPRQGDSAGPDLYVIARRCFPFLCCDVL
ncbi:hypothetical protein VTN02DRAFT_4308 [Thermoascus thermophilus]